MPTAFDFVKKNARSAANAIPSMIDQGRTDLANQQVAANNAAMQTPIQAPEVKAPSNPAQDALNNEMLGRLMKPGRGRRKGQMVTSGGRYSGRTVDEIYGKLQQNGSGPGGGLRTGSLSQGSGIDWLKANRTSGKALARQEANVGATGDRFKAAPKKVARPAMTQAPSVVDTKPMNMAGATPVSPQPVVTSPIAKVMISPAVATPQIPAITPKVSVAAPMAAAQPKIAPQLQTVLNNFQTKPVGSQAPMQPQQPKIAPQLQSALNNFQTKPVGPAMTPPPAAAAPTPQMSQAPKISPDSMVSLNDTLKRSKAQMSKVPSYLR